MCEYIWISLCYIMPVIRPTIERSFGWNWKLQTSFLREPLTASFIVFETLGISHGKWPQKPFFSTENRRSVCTMYNKMPRYDQPTGTRIKNTDFTTHLSFVHRDCVYVLRYVYMYVCMRFPSGFLSVCVAQLGLGFGFIISETVFVWHY